MKAVIVAAGKGSRLWRQTYSIPKTLLPYGGGTILSTIMNSFNQVGINEFVVVVGYQSEFITDYLNKNDNLGYDIKIVENSDWNLGNGISVLVAEQAVGDGDFILSMSDHIVTVSALERIINHPSDNNLLLVDKRVEDIFDIDDATKVALQGRMITNIGKEITGYDGADCGIFRLNGRYFRAMREALKVNQDSISAAINKLIANNDMEAVFMNPSEKWIDIDTPSAYQHSLNNIEF
ncbi:MAG: NTP transferase domain-containing protein [candidate division Zixibacteria bacterium]|nr:NTP transferase domain-containing protein [candidate division Zixibacteria bacterium]